MLIKKILIALLVCSLLFIAVFGVGAYIVVRVTLDHISFVGLGGSTPKAPHETIMVWVGIAGVIGSFIIHPFGAYLVWPEIRQLMSSAARRTIIVLIFASFQLTLLALAFGVVATRNYIVTQRRQNAFRAHEAVVATLDNAKVDVIAKDAKVISDDGKVVAAEVTLQIKNVPFSIPYYEMDIHSVGAEGMFFTTVGQWTHRSISSPYLRVTNKGQKWIFNDIFTKEQVSDDADNVVLRFEFERVKAAPGELPDTITPRLGIWAREDKVYYRDYLFFYRPIPVRFERAQDFSNSRK